VLFNTFLLNNQNENKTFKTTEVRHLPTSLRDYYFLSFTPPAPFLIPSWIKRWPGVNFIIVLQTASTRPVHKGTKRLTTWLSFCAFRIWVCKSCSQNADEIDPRCQFHQYFTSSFCECSAEKHKKDWHLDCMYCAFVKALDKMLLKLIPGSDLFIVFLTLPTVIWTFVPLLVQKATFSCFYFLLFKIIFSAISFLLFFATLFFTFKDFFLSFVS